MPDSQSRSVSGFLFSPILVGLGYGLAYFFASGRPWPGLDARSPFVLASFSGLMIALAMRPVLLRLPWRLDAALLVSLSVLLGMGPAADGLLARIFLALGLAPPALFLARPVLPGLLALLAAGLLMTLLFRPAEPRVGLAGLRARLRMRRPAAWLWRFALLATVALLLRLLLGWGDLLLKSSQGLGLTALVPLNPWDQLLGGMAGGSPNGNEASGVLANGVAENIAKLGDGGVGVAGGAVVILLHWLRGLALFLPLWPIALVLRARWMQLTLVFALLLFVVGDFAPLLLDQPYPSLPWLFAGVGLAAGRAVLLAAAAALLIGQLRSHSD